jgi:DNA polymerase III subunit alpha
VNYTITHLHSDISSAVTNIDSVTKFTDYIEQAKAWGMTAIAFTEHGSVMSWVKKKETCEKYGLKYIHATEAYLTESLDNKIRDNYHVCLYAKNFDGVKELNKMLSIANNRRDGHYHYVPRITFEELYATSDNIIIATACTGGVFRSENEDLKNEYVEFLQRNKHRSFLEIQHHNTEEQKKHNELILKLHSRYNIPIIVATDTHALNETHIKGRDILQKAKNIHFKGEDGWDLVMRSYDEVVKALQIQGVLTQAQIIEGLENTNKLANMVEEFELSRSPKYPKLYENPLDELKKRINKGVKEKKVNKKVNYKSEYLPRIYEELETYIHNDAVDFLLLDSDIKDYARSNGVFCGYSRGSVSGSLIAYLIGMTDVDSVKFNMNFQRFMNKERISLADVDSDWEPNQRDFIKKHIYEMHGVYCADIITFNTIALKGAVKDVARALGYSVDIADQINKQIDTNEREMRNQYPDIFEYVDIINGTIVSIGSHPCGTVVSPIPLDENMGLCSLSTNENPITMLNMKEIDSLNYVKLDILGLDNIEIINETCKMAGIERLTPDNIVDDEKVWLDIRENTAFIFQWESDSAQAYLKQLFSDETVNKIKKLNPNFKYIDLFSVGNGAIRPAGQSYREELAKGVFHDNGHEALNNFMSPTLGYCVYQEQIINFLNQFCGFTMGEGDVVRKGFAKKLGTEQFIPRIKSGFIQTMKEKYNVSEEESEQLIVSFLKVIEDASSYLFSLNHSLPYSYIGYACGYLRYYHPLEFITCALNNVMYKNTDTVDEKTEKIINYGIKKGIKFEEFKFGYSKSKYMCDKETMTIYKGMKSIKYLNEKVSDELYELSKNNYSDPIELFIDIIEITSLVLVVESFVVNTNP